MMDLSIDILLLPLRINRKYMERTATSLDLLSLLFTFFLFCFSSFNSLLFDFLSSLDLFLRFSSCFSFFLSLFLSFLCFLFPPCLPLFLYRSLFLSCFRFFFLFLLSLLSLFLDFFLIYCSLLCPLCLSQFPS